ncbi:MAG: aspartate/glutamate racemase family protein, partial [Parvularculaceae bacterium]|nr:aspartate/glutamate racemase family protein [Parvularculaceae bacterium]
MKSLPTLGILGGMGPLGGADFFRTLVERTPAGREEDHVPVVLLSDPTIPRRPEALASGDMEPVEDALVDRLQILAEAGAQAAVIPCNTAHYWLEGLRKRSSLPILSIVDAGVTASKAAGARRVAVLGTAPTMDGGLYDGPLRAAGLEVAVLDASAKESVQAAIAATKRNALDEAAEALGLALAMLSFDVD